MEIGSMGSTSGMDFSAMKPPKMDSEERAEELASKIAENNDADGDGLLSAEELGDDIDSDTLAALDSDEDGLLSQEELKAGIQSKMEEAEAGFATGTAPSASNMAFMESMHSLAGESMPEPGKAAQAYASTQETSADATGVDVETYSSEQMTLDTLNALV